MIRILPGRLIHKSSDESLVAFDVREDTSKMFCMRCLDHDLSAAILMGLAMVDHPSCFGARSIRKATIAI